MRHHLIVRQLGASLLLGLCLAAPPGARAEANAEATPTISVALSKPLLAAQAQIKAGQWAQALLSLDEASKAVSEPSAHERFVMARMRGVAALGGGQLDLAAELWLPLLADERVGLADRAQVTRKLALDFYQAKRHGEAATWAGRALNWQPRDAGLQQVLAQAQYLHGDCVAAVPVLTSLIDEAVLAGQVPPESTLKMRLICQDRLKDRAGVLRSLEALVTHHPSEVNWGEMLLQLRSQTQFAQRFNIDALRLQEATGSLTEASDAMELAQLCLEAGFPLEAQRVLAGGFARGLLGQGTEAAAHRKLRDQVDRRVAEDHRTQVQDEQAIVQGRKPQALFNLGYQLALNQQAPRGVALMQQALAQGGLKNPDEASLRLGLSGVRAGMAQPAREALARVQSPDGGQVLARLWALQLKP